MMLLYIHYTFSTKKTVVAQWEGGQVYFDGEGDDNRYDLVLSR